MTQDQRNYLAMQRSGHYYDIMRTTMFVLAALAAVIHLGPDGFSAGLAMLVIAATAYGILAGGSALDDMISLRADMDEAVAGSAYGKAINARNLPALKMVSGALLALVGLAELLSIVS